MQKEVKRDVERALNQIKEEIFRYDDEEAFYFSEALRAVSRCMSHGTDKREEKKWHRPSFLDSKEQHCNKGLAHAHKLFLIDYDAVEYHASLGVTRLLMAIAARISHEENEG